MYTVKWWWMDFSLPLLMRSGGVLAKRIGFRSSFALVCPKMATCIVTAQQVLQPSHNSMDKDLCKVI
jgi:hypothetical protein